MLLGALWQRGLCSDGSKCKAKIVRYIFSIYVLQHLIIGFGVFLLYGLTALLYAVCKDECRENAICIFFLNTKHLPGINAELMCDQPDLNLYNFDVFQGNKVINYRI